LSKFGKAGFYGLLLNYSGRQDELFSAIRMECAQFTGLRESALVEDTAKEVERALDNPIGTPPLEHLARRG